MANRVASPNTFAGLPPPWSLTNLDQNFSNITGALNDASLGYLNYIGTDTGSANNYVVTTAYGTPSAYNPGMTVVFTPANLNTGPSTINVNGLGAKAINRPGGGACNGGEIVSAFVCTLVYDGANFRIPALCWAPMYTNLGSISTSQSVDCRSASYVTISFSFASSVSVNIALNNLANCVPVAIYILGNSGATSSFAFPIPKNPAGTVLTASIVQQGQSGINTGITVLSGKAVYAVGSTGTTNLFLAATPSA